MQSALSIANLRRARLNLGRTLLDIRLAADISSAKLSAAGRGLVRLARAGQHVPPEALSVDVVTLRDAEREEAPM
jgi:hypothetical protein